MKINLFDSRYFVLYFVSICSTLALSGIADLHSQETEMSDEEHPMQVDVISGWSPGRPNDTIDLRVVARNIHDKKLYDKAFEALAMTGNAFLSSSTVNLLATALNDDAREVRQRAITLLGYSRNPEAIPAITDSLQNDPSWRVRKWAAMVLGVLAGEAAVPALKAVLAERPTEHSSREHVNYYGNFGFHVIDGALFGLGYAGGEGIPILIKMLEDEIKESGGKGDAISLIVCLEFAYDRRIVPPLIDIISHPASPSDPNWDRVRRRAATILDRLADEFGYDFGVQFRNLLLAKGFPLTPPKNRQVTQSDRVLIREALQTAGYDFD